MRKTVDSTKMKKKELVFTLVYRIEVGNGDFSCNINEILDKAREDGSCEIVDVSIENVT